MVSMKNNISNYDAQLIKKLEQIVAIYDKILFCPYVTESVHLQLGLELSKQTDKKILFIVPDSYMLDNENFCVKRINKEEAEMLIQLYYTYEFSDNFLMITDKSWSAASIFNFVTTGVLTYEEVWKGLVS